MPEVMKRRPLGRPPIRDETFSPDKLYNAMQDAGVRLEYVAAGADLSGRTIQSYLYGASCPSPEIIGRLAEVLEIDPDELRDLPKPKRGRRATAKR